MKVIIRHLFFFTLTFALQVSNLAAQSGNGNFPAPAGLTLRGTAPVSMSLVKAAEKYNDYYQTPSVEGWTNDRKIIIKEFGKTPSLSIYPQPKGQPISLLNFPHPAYNIYPSPDRQNFLHNRDTDGKLNYRMFVWSETVG